MSEVVPLFRVGERVRIMRVRLMKDRGLANRVGTVMAPEKPYPNLVRVVLDGIGINSTPEELEVSSSYLKKAGGGE